MLLVPRRGQSPPPLPAWPSRGRSVDPPTSQWILPLPRPLHLRRPNRLPGTARVGGPGPVRSSPSVGAWWRSWPASWCSSTTWWAEASRSRRAVSQRPHPIETNPLTPMWPWFLSRRPPSRPQQTIPAPQRRPPHSLVRQTRRSHPARRRPHPHPHPRSRRRKPQRHHHRRRPLRPPARQLAAL